MLKNNIEVDVKVKCIEAATTQAKLAEEVGTRSNVSGNAGRVPGIL